MNLRGAIVAAALLTAACATVPIEQRSAGDLDWDANADVGVVEILTHDADGDLRQTKVWFVRVDGQTYLRASDSRWLANIRRDPDVILRVEGVDYPQRAEEVHDPEIAEAVDAAAAEKYGMQDSVVGLFRRSPPDVLRLGSR